MNCPKRCNGRNISVSYRCQGYNGPVNTNRNTGKTAFFAFNDIHYRANEYAADEHKIDENKYFTSAGNHGFFS